MIPVFNGNQIWLEGPGTWEEGEEGEGEGEGEEGEEGEET